MIREDVQLILACSWACGSSNAAVAVKKRNGVSEAGTEEELYEEFSNHRGRWLTGNAVNTSSLLCYSNVYNGTSSRARRWQMPWLCLQ